MKQSKKIVLGILIIIVAISYLIVTGISSFSGYEIGISEFVNSGEDYSGEYLMIPGKLIGDSVKFDGDNIELRFSITDGKSKLPVIYNDVKPDNFEDGVEVFIEGSYLKEENVFKAQKVTTKCPSKYEAEE